MMLTDDLEYHQIFVILGWTGTPAAFHIVTRVISWELRQRLVSSSIMFVDVIKGVRLASDIASDFEITRRACTSPSGEIAVPNDKTVVVGE